MGIENVDRGMTKMKTIMTAVTLSVLLTACGGPGEQATVPEAQPAGITHIDIGNHTVHFSAQSTDNLPPEIARTYNIVRSKNRAMLNVSVIANDNGMPVHANVSVKTVNLTGQLKNVVMREVLEQEAIYYIGETPVANREMLNFDVSIVPDGEKESSSVRFQRQFYTD
jgi:hypothetical protein